VQYQRLCPDGVQIFTSADRVPGQYQEVALLSSKGESGLTDERQMLTSQRKKAAQLGANGLIIGDVKEPNAGTKIIGSLLGTGAERKGSAVAIFIPGDSARVRHACAAQPQPTAPTPAAPDPMTQPTSEPSPQAAQPQDMEAVTLPPGTRYVGDASTKRYYLAACPTVSAIRDRYYFRTEAGAQTAGYTPSTCSE
jgi:hypothetical protein